jgi:hypothetical protein
VTCATGASSSVLLERRARVALGTATQCARINDAQVTHDEGSGTEEQLEDQELQAPHAGNEEPRGAAHFMIRSEDETSRNIAESQSPILPRKRQRPDDTSTTPQLAIMQSAAPSGGGSSSHGGPAVLAMIAPPPLSRPIVNPEIDDRPALAGHVADMFAPDALAEPEPELELLGWRSLSEQRLPGGQQQDPQRRQRTRLQSFDSTVTELEGSSSVEGASHTGAASVVTPTTSASSSGVPGFHLPKTAAELEIEGLTQRQQPPPLVPSYAQISTDGFVVDDHALPRPAV